jgi:hypothetical protein
MSRTYVVFFSLVQRGKAVHRWVPCVFLEVVEVARHSKARWRFVLSCGCPKGCQRASQRLLARGRCDVLCGFLDRV